MLVELPNVYINFSESGALFKSKSNKNRSTLLAVSAFYKDSQSAEKLKV